MRWFWAFAGSLIMHFLLFLAVSRIEPGQLPRTRAPGVEVLNAQLFPHPPVNGSANHFEQSKAQIAPVFPLVAPSSNVESGGGNVQTEKQVVGNEHSADHSLVVRPVPLTELESPDFAQGASFNPGARLVLTVLINQAGRVVEVERNSSTFPAGADDLLIKAFWQMRFRPGLLNGRPVDSSLKVEIRAEDLRLPVTQ